ncbi:MAG: hypothetical protein GC179_27545 [Anaerolineaceae bacterium]|nr:hypothetical protein [Anaerolineaceae bacterium]
MTNDERDLTPNDDISSSGFDQSDDDLRYAPPQPVETSAAPKESEPEAEAVEADDSSTTVVEVVEESLELAETDTESSPEVQKASVDVTSDSLPVNVTDGLDIEAALAAVSTLSDVIAEQEAAEQARVAHIEAEEQAKIERQARIENPERFFAVPPMMSLKRGQIVSIIPALWLIGVGAWLTFSLTTTHTAPDNWLLIFLLAVGLGLTFLARWFASHRWARGSLFFGLVCLLFGGLFFYFNQPNAFGFTSAWPLFIAATGLAMLITRILTPSVSSRLMLPSIILIVAGLAGTVITMGLLDNTITLAAASLWPVALLIIVVIWLFPLVFRQRQ